MTEAVFWQVMRRLCREGNELAQRSIGRPWTTDPEMQRSKMIGCLFALFDLAERFGWSLDDLDVLLANAITLWREAGKVAPAGND